MQNFILFTYLPVSWYFASWLISLLLCLMLLVFLQPSPLNSWFRGWSKAKWYRFSRKSSFARWGRSCSKVAPYWESCITFGLDQLLVTGQVSLCTSEGGANVCWDIASCLVMRSTCCITNRKLGILASLRYFPGWVYKGTVHLYSVKYVGMHLASYGNLQ